MDANKVLCKMENFFFISYLHWVLEINVLMQNLV